MIGTRFKKLVVVSKAHKLPDGHTAWNCVCDCGNTTVVAGNHLRKANGTASCGCARKEHGESVHGAVTGLYRIWSQMRDRCNNPTHKNYGDYGGRGITVCHEWGDYLVFKADMGERPQGRSLDRIDNDKGYSKGNCRWATQYEQKANTRAARWIEFNGKKQVLSAWAREFGTNPGQVHYWILKLGEEAGMNYLLRRSHGGRP